MMNEDEIPVSMDDIDDDAQEIIEEVAKELDVDLEEVIMPYHKIDILWEDLSEDEFREHMRETLKMLKQFEQRDTLKGQSISILQK